MSEESQQISRGDNEISQEQRMAWARKAVETFDERQGKFRGAKWQRWGTNKRSEREDDAFQAELNKLLASELFQRIKHRYVESEAASDEIALVSFMACGYCTGSLEFVLTETPEQHPPFVQMI